MSDLTLTMLLKLVATAFMIMAASACSWLPFSNGDVQAEGAVATLADLNPAVLPDKTASLPKVDLGMLVATYREVLTVTDDPDIRLQVLHRLAGLEMLRGEQRLYEQTIGGEFNLAIKAYLTLLKNNPDHPDNDKLLYQLSKAYDLGGEIEKSKAVLDQLVLEFPDSIHIGEAQFRRAEIYFSRADYRNAELAYAAVISQGSSNHHYPNALYMHGWSQFKRQRYRASLKSFSAVLDLNVPDDNNLETLSRGQRELTLDTFRVMSVVFSYLDGARTIDEIYQSLGERAYVSMLYDNLGKLYLEKERYRDSAETYRAYIEKYPQADQSPVFYSHLISAYREGGFPENVLQEKENYIRYYGIYSEYWQNKTDSSRDFIRPSLEKYLPELARHYHAQAQAGSKKISESKNLLAKARTSLQQAKVNDYLKAGDYYQQFIDTFPDDPEVPEIYFLLAESRFEAGVYDQAIEAYEIVAYDHTGHKRGNSAGYAAIIAYSQLLSNLDKAENSGQYEQWLRLKIASQLRFSSVFHSDSRASVVLVKSAEELLGLEEYRQALDAAKVLVGKDIPVDPALRKTAWLVIGHGEFELQNYPGAEQAYLQTLAIMSKDDAVRPDIVERLAASVYKQAELTLAAGNQLQAAEQFLRVAQVAPTAAISITAQFDAANVLLATENFQQAIVVLERFRQNYPNNPLAADIPAKMVVAYQQSGQWSQAALELTAIYQKSVDPVVKQESLYQAAELYEKAGDITTAILRYRSYAHAYPEPFAPAMEARFKLSELYQGSGQADKSRFWLRKMIAADRAAGDQRTDRSRYLAAFSASVFADDDYQRFSKIQLSLPLKNSLKKKKKALKQALSAYQNVSDYGVEEFSTQATYRIGAIYNLLSSDLMASQRPKNLDQLALEQYEVLLEEQAFPFEEKAIEVHEANVQRSRDGIYDRWVKESFAALKVLLPARYGKDERGSGFVNEIY